MSTNIVVICLDTVRKDVFDEHAQLIRQMADEDYEQCRAASCWSTPSHASLLTGELPHQHGLSTYQRDFTTLDRESTFLSDLDDYTTYAVSSNEFIGSAFGFDHLFDDFVAVSPRRRFSDGLDPLEYTQDDRSLLSDGAAYVRAALSHDHTLQSLANGGIGAIKKFTPRIGLTDPFDAGASSALRYARRFLTRDTDPSFLFVNLMDAHLPLRKHRGMDGVSDIPASWSTLQRDTWELMNEKSGYEHYWENRQALYAAAVRYLDRKVAEFIETIQAETNRKTIVVVTADHGENLGFSEEDYLVNHTSSLSEGLLHVPLAVITEGETTIETPTERYVSHLEFPELIRGASIGSIPDVSRDRTVAEVLGRGPTPDPPDEEEFWNRTIRCAYEGTSKTVWDSLEKCIEYHLDSERPSWQEEYNSNAVPPSWAMKWFETDIDTVERERSDHNVKAGTRQRLEELGYL